MARYFLYILIVFLCVAKQSVASSQRADTINFLDCNGAVFIISTSDYMNYLNKKLGGKSKMYAHYIDSISSITSNSILLLDKGYCRSLSFYEREEYEKLDHALMNAFQENKMRISKEGVIYNSANTKIFMRKRRRCSKPTGNVIGTNWVIKSSKNATTITELYKSKTRHADRICNCF